MKWILMAAITVLTPAPAWAWGAAGHEIAATIALDSLSPAARRQVTRLLGAPSMLVHDANWADEIKSGARETGRWHFVDIPRDAPAYERVRDCPDRDCVVEQIALDARLLASRTAPLPQRAQALRFLVHLVADVHQPLHVIDHHDRGGNAVRVRLGDERANLHHVWDVDVVDALGPDTRAAARAIEQGVTPAQRKAWQSGDAVQWANESHALAQHEIYDRIGDRRTLRLPGDYALREKSVTRMQLARSGYRLAWLLNRILG